LGVLDAGALVEAVVDAGAVLAVGAREFGWTIALKGCEK